MPAPEEENIVRLLKNDDRSAVRSLFEQYHVLLCRLSYRIVNDPDDARDVVQEVFIKLWTRRRDLQIATSLQSYLKRSVVNASLNRLEQKRKMIRFDDRPEAARGNMHFTMQDMEAQELSGKIDEAISGLPPRTKAVFTLIRFDEMSYREVAETLHISVKAVEKEMMKALKLLREACRDYLALVLIPLNIF